MKKSLLALAIALVPSLAWAQGAVLQNGPVTKFDLPGWVQDKTIMSGGKMFTDNFRGFNPAHIFDNHGPGVCTEDALTSGPYHQICIGHDTSGNGLITLDSLGGASAQALNIRINGTTYNFPSSGAGAGNMTGPNPSVINDVVLFNGTNGAATKGTLGDFSYTPGLGFYLGLGVANTSNSKVTVQHTYAGGGGSAPSAIFGHLNYNAASGAGTNPDGIYGDIWYNSATTFDGLGSAIRGNAYTIPQISVTIQTPGTGYTNGDFVVAVGGTCNTSLNTPPVFQLTVSGGVVTAASYVPSGSCTVYPTNPVSVTGGTGSGLTINLSHSNVNVTYLAGVYGRGRHTSRGTVTNSVALFADGAYNAGGGTLTNAIGVWLQPPYDAVGNAYGIWQAGTFGGGTIGSLIGADISFNPGNGANSVTATGPIYADNNKACFSRISGGSSGQIASQGTNCWLTVVAQAGGSISLLAGNISLATFTASSLTGVNYVAFNSGAATLFPPIIAAAGGDTNIDLAVQGKGTGTLQFSSASSFATNGSVATVLGSLGPAGSHTAVQKWLAIKDGSGTVLYVPAF